MFRLQSYTESPNDSCNIYMPEHIPHTQLSSQKLLLQCHEMPPVIWDNKRWYHTNAHVLPTLFPYPFDNISFFLLQPPTPVPIPRFGQEVFPSAPHNIDNTFL